MRVSEQFFGGFRLDVTLIVARGRNGVIGRDGALPWRLPGDLAQFRANTIGKPVIMGRKTWDSIGRPLPKRRNIVISRDPAFRAPGADVAGQPEAALAFAAGCAVALRSPEICIIGGAAIYRSMMALATRIRLTEVDLEPDGDVRFEIDRPEDWREISASDHSAGPGDDCGFTVRVLARRL